MEWVRIGSVRVKRKVWEAGRSGLVPRGYTRFEDPWWRREVQWLLKKYQLRQDAFLLGPPSSHRRALALGFCELVGLEMEMVVLNRDVTEADLKQRREIRSDGTIEFVDAPPLKAALNGRVLVLDGIEKAERNVLPALNNLLENREMHLLDGRKLVSASFFDSRVKELGITPEIARQELGLERTHEDFRVIALGIPVPTYPGYPLDPPLRSRFQCRFVTHPIPTTQVNDTTTSSELEKVRKWVESIHLIASKDLVQNKKFNFLPENAFERIHKSLELSASESRSMLSIVQRSFPGHHLFDGAQDASILYRDLCKPFECDKLEKNDTHDAVDVLPSGFVRTKEVDDLLHAMQAEHSNGMVKNLCLIGPGGSGKTTLAMELSRRLGKHATIVHCYKDMSSRELTVTRATNEDGSTAWRHSPLVRAAVQGEMLILDGLDRLRPDTIASIGHLLHERDLVLSDGSRLLRHDRYDLLAKELGHEPPSDFLRVHPDFSVLALSKPPTSDKSNDWLSAEVLTMFTFFDIPTWTTCQAAALIQHQVGFASIDRHVVERALKALQDRRIKLNFLKEESHQVVQGENNGDKVLDAKLEKDLQLSLRQVIRVVGNWIRGEDLNDILRRSLLLPFRSQTLREAFEANLGSIPTLESPPSIQSSAADISEKAEGFGSEPRKQDKLELIPQVEEFVDMPHQMQYMEAIQKDLEAGDHVLLIGNQGTGKNKITDRLLELMGLPREYLQLSRDSTVNSLTVIPTLLNGRIMYVDSPLVRAAAKGHVLVLDEADKAAVEVVSVLKGLLTDGEMYLADGRRIVSPSRASVLGAKRGDNSSKVIRLHPDFRVICLANRPGYPFLGNDFFHELSDCFSSHVIGNGTLEDQMLLLKSLAPHLENDQVRALAKSFDTLRQQCEQGLLKYPFSTREAAAVARHIESFPGDGLREALQNVFDFDRLDKDVMDTIQEAFSANGISISRGDQKSPVFVNLTSPEPALESDLAQAFQASGPAASHFDLTSQVNAGNIQTSALRLRNVTFLLDTSVKRQDLSTSREEGRQEKFSEELVKFHFSGMATEVGAANPVTILSSTPHSVQVVSKTPAFLSSSIGLPHVDVTQNIQIDKLIGTGVAVQAVSLGTGHIGLFAPRVGCGWVVQVDGQGAFQFSLPEAFLGRSPLTSRFSSANPVMFEVIDSSSDQLGCLLRSTATNQLLWFPSPLEPASLQDGNLPVFMADAGRTSESSTPEESQQNQRRRMYVGQERKVAVVQSSSTRLAVFDGVRGSKRNFTFDDEIVDFCFIAEGEQLGVLFKNGFVRVLEIDACKTEKALESWLDQFSISSAILDTDLDVEIEVDSPPSSHLVSSLDSDVDDSSSHPTQGFAEDAQESGSSASEITPGTRGGRASNGRGTGGSWGSGRGGGGQGQGASGMGGSGGGGGGGEGAAIDRSDGWGGYQLDKLAALSQMSVSERIKVGLPVTEEQAKSYLADLKEKEATASAVLKEQEKRLAIQDLAQGSGRGSAIYNDAKERMSKQIKELKLILEAQDAKQRERTWLPNKPHGELDDEKLVHGITGDAMIYKQRGVPDKVFGLFQEKPKKMLFVLDTSASMARANDDRLTHMVDAVVMLIECLDSYQHKYSVAMTCHSGSSPNMPLIRFGEWPNNVERKELCSQIISNARSAVTGDNTLDAARQAIAEVAEQDGDDYFVILLSDANLGRYSITPKEFGSVLTINPTVHAHAIFIAEPSASEWLTKELPLGKGHSCLDPRELPRVLASIFEDAAASFNDDQ